MSDHSKELAELAEQSALQLWQAYCDKKMECERLHEENETLNRCLFQMQEAAKKLAQPDNTSDSATRSADSAESFCDTHCTWRDHHPDCELAQPSQEPWLWIRKNYSQGTWISNRLPEDPENWDAVYKEPPKREWVGLTDEEIKKIYRTTIERITVEEAVMCYAVARDIEAKLKDKNVIK